jgi:hypothetical protein
VASRSPDRHLRRIWLSLLTTAQQRGWEPGFGESEAEFLHRVIRAAPDLKAERRLRAFAVRCGNVPYEDGEW